jgi:hypothetical protein
VLLADGGDALSDLAVLRDQPELFGPVASTATAWRVVERVAADELGLAGLRAARAQARGRAWRAGACPRADLLLVDLDGTLLDGPRTRKGRPGPPSTASGSTRCWPSWTAATAPARRWQGSCGRVTPAPTPPPTTSRSPSSRSPNSQPAPGTSRSWCGPTPAVPPMPWSTTCASVACGSRSACRLTSASAPRCWPFQTAPGPRRSILTARLARVPRSPNCTASTWPAGRRAPERSAGARTLPGRPAVLHRRRRAPLPGVHHRPGRS